MMDLKCKIRQEGRAVTMKNMRKMTIKKKTPPGGSENKKSKKKSMKKIGKWKIGDPIG
jgi:hypothetical protein